MDIQTTDSQIAFAFARHRDALPALRAQTVEQRLAKLAKTASLIQANFNEILAALSADVGKPAFEAAFEVGSALAEIGEISANLAKWVQPQDTAVSVYAAPGATAKVIYQPKGQILIFGPWNFPFALVLQPLIGAVAAGNSVVLKPSELAPATADIIEKIVAEVFDPSEVSVFQGGVDIANQLLAQPFDHVFFTGSTQIGRQVMAAAARNLSSVTLELGGRCPAIIDTTASLHQAAERIAWGKFLNAGQICLAPDHVWIKREQLQAFVTHLSDYVARSYKSSGSFNRADFARIINERNHARVSALIDDAVKRGAHIAFGGTRSGQDLFIEPTVLVNVAHDSDIMAEEIFGPVLPVLTYRDQTDLLEQLNQQPKPLALYVFSEQPEFVEAIIAKTSSGGVTVNDVIRHAADSNLPFGGIGASGMGRYHGYFSFLEFSHARSVYYQPEENPTQQFFQPPYGDRLPI